MVDKSVPVTTLGCGYLSYNHLEFIWDSNDSDSERRKTYSLYCLEEHMIPLDVVTQFMDGFLIIYSSILRNAVTDPPNESDYKFRSSIVGDPIDIKNQVFVIRWKVRQEWVCVGIPVTRRNWYIFWHLASAYYIRIIIRDPHNMELPEQDFKVEFSAESRRRLKRIVKLLEYHSKAEHETGITTE